MKKLSLILCITMLTIRSNAGTVTTLADSGPGSLRAILGSAGNGETITFAPNVRGVIGLTSGQLAVNQNVTIGGPGPTQLQVARTGVQRFRIFLISQGRTVTIRGLGISNGYADANIGGGILNDQATLTLDNCLVTNNTSDSGDGGGGIYNNGGSLTLTDSTFINNRATYSGNPVGFGGAVSTSGTLSIRRCLIQNNFAAIKGGGVLINSGTAEIIDSEITGNQSSQGGGIDSRGILTITNSTVSGNIANVGGNIASSGPLTISGSAATPTPTPGVTPTPSPNPTVTPTPTVSPTPTPAPTASPCGVQGLLNMSNRGDAGTGEHVMILGFIARGDTPIVVRGIGPSLSVSNTLQDPVLELHDNNGTLVINDDWQDDPVSASQLIFFDLAPTDSKEAAIYARLPGGYYTAILKGKNGGTGVGLVEAYDVE